MHRIFNPTIAGSIPARLTKQRRYKVTQREQQKQSLARVRTRIGDAVRDFVNAQDGKWTADDLRRHVHAKLAIAPASADRVLRDLRQRGVIDYENVSRRESVYLTIKKEEAA